MSSFKDMQIKAISSVFVKNNIKTLLISSIIIFIITFVYPNILSPIKLSIIFFAGLVYFVSTWIFIKKIKDITELTWVISLPLVVYCSAHTNSNLNLSNEEKNVSIIFYLALYFFIISLFYRVSLHLEKKIDFL